MIKKTIQPKHLNSRYYDIISNDSTFDFFNVRLEDRYGFGLNSLSIRPTNLLPSSQIEIEILDSENKPLYHEISDIISSDNSRLITIYIYPETKLGQIKFYVAGITKNNQSILWTDTRTLYGIETISAPIYKEFPSVLVVEQQIPEYINLSGSLATVNYGRDILSVINQPQTMIYNSNINDGYTDPTFNYLISSSLQLDQLQIGNRSSTPFLDKSVIFANNARTFDKSDYSVVKINLPWFTKTMEGGVLTLNVNSLLQAEIERVKTTLIREDWNFMSNNPFISSSIQTVVDPQTVIVRPKVKYTYKNKLNLTTFNSIEDYTASYYDSYTATSTSTSQSHLYLQFNNLQPVVGSISDIEIYIKNKNSLSGFSLLDIAKVKPVELLIDNSSTQFNPITGINYNRPGFPTTDTDVSSSWDITTYGKVTGSFDITDNTSKFGSIYVSSSVVYTNSYITITPNYTYDFIGFEGQYYTLSCNVTPDIALLERMFAKDGPKQTSTIEFYISGSLLNIESDIRSNLQPLSNFGTLVGLATTNKNINVSFSPKTDANLKLYIVIRGGHWRIKDVSIKPSKLFGFTPNTFYCTSKVPKGIYSTEIDLKLIFKNGDKSTEPLYIKKYYINGNV